MKEKRTLSKAVLAVEVISPSTRSHDLKLKLLLYREEGLSETWGIGPKKKAVIVACAGKPSTRCMTSRRLHSLGLPGSWIDVSWLWEDPLPPRLRRIKTILASCMS
jgi:Uma2 family endonuclease